MVNSISVDVEEYFHAANLEPYIGRKKWPQMPSRVESSTKEVLDIFDACNTKGTFFVLGYVGRRFPSLVKEIVKRGHEIGSHGFRHHLAYEQTPNAFYRDISTSKKLLEDISGQPVLGYRAPNFSITDRNPWAYDKLLEAGYLYDSSVYPTWHPRYTNLGKPRHSYTLESGLHVFPLAVGNINLLRGNIPLPVAGGAYWRLLPRWYNSFGLNRISNYDKWPFHCYFHPWEIDAGQPQVSGMPFKTKLRHYGRTATFGRRLEYFLKTFSFAPIKEVGKQTFGESFGHD